MLFFTCHVKVTFDPTAGPPLFDEPTIWISALTLPVPLATEVVELAVLFAVFGSVVFGFPARSRRVIVAESVMEAAPIATVTFTVVLVPACMPPRVQLNSVPEMVQTPCVVVAETNGAGRLSARVTFGASPGPLLETFIVKVTNEPALTEEGELIVIAMS